MLNMRFPGGVKKALTLSYDDANYDDMKLMDMMDEYGVKGTFNVSSGIYREEGTEPEGGWPRLTLSEAQKHYKEHGVEIAVPGLEHRNFTTLTDAELNYEIAADRANLEMQYGMVVRGAAYPYGAYDDRSAAALRANGIKYCRTVNTRDDFELPEDWLHLRATAHHNDPYLGALADKFLELDPDTPKLFYLWGHTAEFRRDGNWDVIEGFLKRMGGRQDIWYATNIEICEYHMAYKALEYSVSPQSRMVYNPSAKQIWLSENTWSGEKLYSVKPGETLSY